MKHLLRKIYHATPPGLREVLGGIAPIGRIRRCYLLTDTTLHDEYYTDEYYAAESAPTLCRAIIERFRPADVIDVGCGAGEYLEAFREAGITGHGIELASAALRRCHEKKLDVVRIDLTTAVELPWRADLVYSFEVAEHIPESSARSFVRAIASAAKRNLVITAAGPGQNGLCHLNCREKGYWIELFCENGFAYDGPATERWEAENKAAGLVAWFCQNLMAYRRDVGAGSLATGMS